MTDGGEERVFIMVPREIEMDAGLDGTALGIEPRGALAAEHGRGLKDMDFVLVGRRQ